VQDAAGGLAAEQVQADEPSDVVGGRAPRDKGCGAVLHDPTAVTGASCDAAAAWRGAFLAHGALTGRRGAARLQVSSPGPEAALALVGAARRLGVAAKTKQVGRADLVVVSDGDAIEALLGQLRAAESVVAWQERQRRRGAGAALGAVASLDTANQRRSAEAAAGVARVQTAMALLAGEAPQHLLTAGRLRLEHPQASLEQLADRADPPMTKDAVAGRLRRLLHVAATNEGYRTRCSPRPRVRRGDTSRGDRVEPWGPERCAGGVRGPDELPRWWGYAVPVDLWGPAGTAETESEVIGLEAEPDRLSRRVHGGAPGVGESVDEDQSESAEGVG